jgi:hypothetical protein
MNASAIILVNGAGQIRRFGSGARINPRFKRRTMSKDLTKTHYVFLASCCELGQSHKESATTHFSSRAPDRTASGYLGSKQTLV